MKGADAEDCEKRPNYGEYSNSNEPTRYIPLEEQELLDAKEQSLHARQKLQFEEKLKNDVEGAKLEIKRMEQGLAEVKY